MRLYSRRITNTLLLHSVNIHGAYNLGFCVTNNSTTDWCIFSGL